MPVVGMPNGDQVQFPDDMPNDQIKSLILKKFPDAGGQSSLRDRALNSLPPELREYARKALSPADLEGQHNPPSYSPLKPADPNNMPNDAINPVGTDAQMTAGLGAAGAMMRGLGSIPRPAPATPPGPSVPQTGGGTVPSAAPTLRGPGGQMQANPNYVKVGAQPPPGPWSSPATSGPPSPGIAAQQSLLQQVAQEAQKAPGLAKTLIHGAGHALGGPAGGVGANILTHFLKL